MKSLVLRWQPRSKASAFVFLVAAGYGAATRMEASSRAEAPAPLAKPTSSTAAAASAAPAPLATAPTSASARPAPGAPSAAAPSTKPTASTTPAPLASASPPVSARSARNAAASPVTKGPGAAVEVALAWQDAVNANDPVVLAKRYGAKAIVYGASGPALAGSKAIAGREQARLGPSARWAHIGVTRLFPQGQFVIIEWLRNGGTNWKSGFQIPGADVLQFDDTGLITSDDEYFSDPRTPKDASALPTSIELYPPAPAADTAAIVAEAIQCWPFRPAKDVRAYASCRGPGAQDRDAVAIPTKTNPTSNFETWLTAFPNMSVPQVVHAWASVSAAVVVSSMCTNGTNQKKDSPLPTNAAAFRELDLVDIEGGKPKVRTTYWKVVNSCTTALEPP
jgi:hypothetical protein